MTKMEAIRARHSVRQYLDKKIEEEKRQALDAMAKECNEKSGLHLQVIYDEPKCSNAVLSKVMRFKNCANYIAVVGKKNDLLLEEKAGYYGEMLVLLAQELGLNTCWVAATHGKCAAQIAEDEKLAIVIALGYGANQGVPHKGKTAAQVSDVTEDLPDWYAAGLEAALLAPTAVNQQRFHISLLGDTVSITADNKAYAMMDLGIVKYHFEVASGRKCL